MPRLIAPPPQKMASPPKKRLRGPFSAKPMPIEPLVLRPVHAAQALQISKRTLWEWIRAGMVEVARPAPGITLVRMDSIRKLIEPAEPPAA